MIKVQEKTPLQKKISALPHTPGCYIFTNTEGKIIYIGKSKNLKNRVKQYFQKIEEKENKYKKLSLEIYDVEIRNTPTERDALILECQLIKQYRPKYNAQLKREKRYPYIKIDSEQDYPTITIQKECIGHAYDFYGFFYNDDDAFAAIQLLNLVWKTPICGKAKFAKNHRPCLKYHLNKCCAPCVSNIDKEEYSKKITEIRKCFSGSDDMLKRMNQAMKKASLKMEFEQAAEYRDIIKNLRRIQKKSKRLNTFFYDREVYLFFHAYHEIGYSLFYILDGAVRGRMDMNENVVPEQNILELFIKDRKNIDKDLASEEERFLTSCLVAIYADKYYVTVQKRMSFGKLIKVLHEGAEEFLSVQNI